MGSGRDSNLSRAILVGAASGMRTTAGLGVLILARPDRVPPVLRHRFARPAAVVAVATELVLDKLPMTGSRLEPPGLIGRVLFAGTAAALLAGGRRERVLSPILVAVGSALITAKVAHDIRARAATHVGDRPLAVIEDALALAVAKVAVSR